MNLHVTHSVLIPVPIDQAWTYIAEGFFAHHSTWDPSIVEMTQTTYGSLAVGSRGIEVRRAGGTQRSEFEITEFTPRRRFSFRTLIGPADLRRTFQFQPEAGSTTVTFDFDMTPRQLMMRLLFPMLRRSIAQQVVTSISRLPQVVTAPPTTRPAADSPAQPQ